MKTLWKFCCLIILVRLLVMKGRIFLKFMITVYLGTNKKNQQYRGIKHDYCNKKTPKRSYVYGVGRSILFCLTISFEIFLIIEMVCYLLILI